MIWKVHSICCKAGAFQIKILFWTIFGRKYTALILDIVDVKAPICLINGAKRASGITIVQKFCFFFDQKLESRANFRQSQSK